jgi:hypothetical protein
MSNIRDKKKNILFNYTLTSIAMYALVGISTAFLLHTPFTPIYLPSILLHLFLFVFGMFIAFCLYRKVLDSENKYWNSED